MLAGRGSAARLQAPNAVNVGEMIALRVVTPAALRAEVAVVGDAGLRMMGGGRAPVTADGAAVVRATAMRRGTARISGVDVRWQGPLGLVWRLQRTPVERSILVTPDLRPVHDEGVALMSQDAQIGMMAQLNTGAAGEFDALAEYQAGMDRRRIAWKQSARHGELLVREYRTERDNNIVLAFDCGRTMVEPIAGLPRIDRAISAGLLTAYASLKMGDRVSVMGFAAKAGALSAASAGPGSFAAVKRAVAGLEYSAEEANFTLAMSVLAQKLDRRSLIILFTDFVDTISAELMLRSIGRLLKTHLLLCVVMQDEELETLVSAAPVEADDVSRAVVAAGLLRERRIVLTRLRRMGVDVLEAPWRELGPALARRYLETKRQQRL